MSARASEPSRVVSEEGAARSVAVAEHLANWSDDALLMEIGFRAEALRLDPAIAETWNWSPTLPTCENAPFPGLCKLGDRLVSRLDRQIVEIVAQADDLDDLDRRRLLAASGLAGNVAVAEIASALVAGFGLAPPIAPLAAAALCRRGSPEAWRVLSGRSVTKR